MIWMGIKGLPPSSNHAYSTLRSGRRVLAAPGRKYKRETPAYFAQHFREELMVFRKNVPLCLVIRFSFPQLENKTWPESCDTRYKKSDAGNRLKLVEDALKDAAGVDDSQNTVVALKKQQGPEEFTDIWVWDLEQEECPFDLAFNRL